MRGASASATRAQWAGYEAPDEKEDEWPIVSLPSEMIHEYGSRRVFDFSVDADRAILGFRPLPREEADSLSEELEGVIGRLADPDSPLSSYQPTSSEKWYSLTPPQPPHWHSIGIEFNECTLSQPASPAPEVTESLAVGGGDATEEAEAGSPVLTSDTLASPKGYPIRGKRGKFTNVSKRKRAARTSDVPLLIKEAQEAPEMPEETEELDGVELVVTSPPPKPKLLFRQSPSNHIRSVLDPVTYAAVGFWDKAASSDPDEGMATAARVADEDTTEEIAPTAQLGVQKKPITANRLWSEEEIQFCADFWFKSRADNPGQNPGQEAGFLCVEAMKQAGYTRSLKGVLSRFARFARHKKLDQ
ncbi:hypothetical protein CspHIS471_0206070 [Cutaneotrichosporon sp. HIS471]|nr:hypothetical protein CspHIS471_0206070 [Cutaneotrichosporon sp. HIS471]